MNQFTNLPEDRQEHAFNMFLSLDLETLSQVIGNELTREREAAEQARLAQEAERRRQQEALRARQEQEARQRVQEVPRSQAATSFNRFNPSQFTQQQNSFQQRQPQQQQQFRQQSPQQQFFQGRQQPQQQFQTQFQQPQQQVSQQDLRHFAQAEAQIAEAVRLQNCLANPSGAGCQ